MMSDKGTYVPGKLWLNIREITSPSDSSVKIQIMGGKVWLRWKGTTIAGCCQQTFENKMFSYLFTQNYFLLITVHLLFRRFGGYRIIQWTVDIK